MPIETSNKLKAWLSRGECQTLRTVVGSLLKDQQAKALENAVKASENNKLEHLAQKHLEAAQRYAIFLEVLHEIDSVTGDHQIAKLS